MDAQKFRIVLSGKPRDGFNRDIVAESLSGLLRMPLEQALGMLGGERFRIRKELGLEKAEQLQEKLVTRGVACAIEPVLAKQHAASDHAIEESEEVTHLELDLPEMDEDDDSSPLSLGVTANGEVRASPDLTPDLTIVLKSPPPLEESKQEQKVEDTGNPGQIYAQRSSAGSGTENKISGLDATKRTRLLALAGVLLVIVSAWLIVPILIEDDSVASVDKGISVAKVAPVIKPEMASTHRRLDLLTKSVKVWMIQFGTGFDPFQVTLDRLSQDLGVTAIDMLDGWGMAFRYEPSEGRYKLLSAGPDKQFGTGDDLQQEVHLQ